MTINNVLRLVFPVPNWEDYLILGFDEIRLYGATSVQVMRRLRSALVGLRETFPSHARADAVAQYLAHVDVSIDHSPLDAMDRKSHARGSTGSRAIPRVKASRSLKPIGL